MKKIRILSLILILVLAASLFVGCGKKEEAATGSDKVIWYVIGTEEPDNQKVFELVNNRIKEEEEDRKYYTRIIIIQYRR